MAITLAQFRLEFPEFNAAPDNLVSAMLARAVTLTPNTVWGGDGAGESLTEQGTLVRCAWLLSMSPYSRKMALVDDNGTNLYEVRLTELKRMVTSGNRVL